MMLCIIGKGMTEGTAKALGKYETVTVGQFSRASGIEVKEWIKKCPCERCFGLLRITATDDNEFSLFCENCGWLPTDGFLPENWYVTLPELEEQSGISYTVLARMAGDGSLPARDFGVDTRGKWRVPRSLAKELTMEHHKRWRTW